MASNDNVASRFVRSVIGLPIGCLVGVNASAARLQAAPWERHVVDGSSRADGVKLADVNGDSRPDVVTGWEEGGRIGLCLHPGPAKVREPWPTVTVGRVSRPEDAVLVDLDGDGALDVVSATEGRDRSLHWAPRDRTRLLNGEDWKTAAFPATAGKQL